MDRLAYGRSAEEKRFGFSYPDFAKKFHFAADALNVGVLRPSLYCLRHGGASHDRLVGARHLEEVRQRGAWRAHSSVTRYDKHARLGLQIARLGRACRCRLENMTAEFETVFMQRLLESF